MRHGLMKLPSPVWRRVFLWFASFTWAVAALDCIVAGFVVDLVRIYDLASPSAGDVMEWLPHAACDILRGGEGREGEKERY